MSMSASATSKTTMNNANAPATAREGLNQRDERNDPKLILFSILSTHADGAAAAFKHDRVAPHAVMPRNPFAPAHFAETVLEVQGHARMIFGEYARLQRPDAV